MSQRESFYTAAIELDNLIPFIPHFIYGYSSVYITILLLYFVIKDIGEFQRIALAMFILTSICYCCFLLIPVKMILRPDLSEMTGFSIAATRWFYEIDKPYNCFPSLHVAYPTLALLMTWKKHRTARWFFLLMTIVIIPSVFFVKQHYIADAAAGIIAALIAQRMSLKIKRRSANICDE